MLATIAASHTAPVGSGAALSAGYATALRAGAAIFVATTIAGALTLPARLGAPADDQPGRAGGLISRRVRAVNGRRVRARTP